MTVQNDAPLHRSLEQARRGLVEIGQRNRLIHVPRDLKRAKALPIVDASADDVFRTLIRDRRPTTFLTAAAAPAESGERAGAPLVAARRPAQDSSGGRASSIGLQTRLAPEPLKQRLVGLYRDARTLEEEQGVNILFLAVGFLRWYEDRKSETPREAPLILLPVSLIRDESRSTLRLAAREDDIATNLSLQERLRQDFALSLPEMPDDDEWLPSAYFDAVGRAVSSETRWSIDPDRMVLGFFSFAKLLMYRDLMPESWPADTLTGHPLLRGLLTDGFSREEPLFDDHVSLDELLDPADLIHVVDADASQALVIETARRGRNLVVQGPPGTGKSQTIANIIATAAHAGRKVLFVAEKMAALDVVHHRLVAAGLGDLCLQLHSRQANKKAVLHELARTLGDSPEAAADGGSGDELLRLRQVRDRLNRDAARLHRPVGESGMTAYRALGIQVKLAGEGHLPPQVDLPQAVDWGEVAFRELTLRVERLAELTIAAGPLSRHPWAAIRPPALQPTDRRRLETGLGAVAEQGDQVEAMIAGLATLLRIEAVRTLALVPNFSALLRQLAARPPVTPGLLEASAAADLDRLAALAERGRALQAQQDRIDREFTPAAATADLTAVRAAIAGGVGSFWARWFPRYRRACRELTELARETPPKAASDRLAVVDRLIEFRALGASVARDAEHATVALGGAWRADPEGFTALERASAWLRALAGSALRPSLPECVKASADGDRLRLLADQLDAASQTMREHLAVVARLLTLDTAAAFGAATPDGAAVAEIARRARDWSAQCGRLDEWGRLLLAHQAVCDAGAGDLAARLGDGRLPPERATSELAYVRAEAVWKAAAASDPELAAADGGERSAAVALFRDIETRRRGLVAAEIRARHRAAMPWGALGAMAVIRGEIGRQRGHMPIRKLMQRAGSTLQQIKPVLLMSPLSVAQFLPPGNVEFDLLVIDEASQVKPEDALGAFARARQVVVVGDKKQLPPTAFFDRLVNSDDDEEGDDDAEVSPLAGAADARQLESILALCEARGMSDRLLSWHYRSRHPSLIAVSNEEFYDGRLLLPPSPTAAREVQGLCLRRVAGAYDRGGKRTNAIEARAVVEAVARHASVEATRALSLGIVTFSIAQRDLIHDLLEDARRVDPGLDALLREKRREELFVKNLENVQGDERDVVLISIGYGPRVAGSGLDSMSFGPVSGDGGERRLNVLFTRARVRCEIFASFDSGDIDLARTTLQGPRVLKRFLRFAETGMLDMPAATGGEAESPFEEAVAAAIAAHGYVADPQVGSAGFRIDLAVRDPRQPGHYVLAVECDGASYHAARWARERDRLRQEILEGMGWSFHRIWSTDWFSRPEIETGRLVDAIAAACHLGTTPACIEPEAALPTTPDGLSSATESAGVSLSHDDAGGSLSHAGIVPYREIVLDAVQPGEPHEMPTARLATLVVRIVEAEGPIHADEVVHRVARLFGKRRAGNRIGEATARALDFGERVLGEIAGDHGFWDAAKARSAAPVRSRADASPSLRRADRLPPTELRDAIKIALRANGALSRDEVSVAVARLLGLQRTGAELRVVIDAQAEVMIGNGQLEEEDGAVRLAAAPVP